MAVLDPLATSRQIRSGYLGYLASTFSPQRADLRAEFVSALESGIQMTKGPLLQAAPPFVSGASIADLIEEGVLSHLFRRFRPDVLPIERPLYLHQETAIRKASTLGRNLVVSTGTGSGKTETFLLPILEHLLREVENDTVGQPGVRALLLYPMNALANDQVKRLRRMLKAFPEITFGRYVGETKNEPQEAEDDFRNRYPLEPRLPNELISRQQMQRTPPHILLTNYAMLEYLLLRPTDSPLFDGATGTSWRFIVLDEAHVYNGAQGTEVAMLLRRLKDRVVESTAGRLQCFATSATLGRGEIDHPQLVEFASDLFSEPFNWSLTDASAQDVVVATRKPLADFTAATELDPGLILPLHAAFRAGQPPPALADIVSMPAFGTESTESFLHRLLAPDRRVVRLQQMLEDGVEDLTDVARTIFTSPYGTDELVALIDLCVAARRSPTDSPLIPARYHFFIRSLEGAYVCLHPDHQPGEPRLLLTRHDQCPSCGRHGRTAAMFELGVCRHCRAEYLLARTATEFDKSGKLALPLGYGSYDYFLLGDATDGEDEDELAVDDLASADGVPQYICPSCADYGDEGFTCGCAHPPARLRTSMALNARGEGQALHTCISCRGRSNSEVVLRFETGTDAPVAVIATDLYQAIPPSDDSELRHEVGQGRKLLAFSDSRQDAAFFAPYLERTYARAVRRRLIMDAVASLSAPGEHPRAEDLVNRLSRAAQDALVLDPDAGAIKNRAEVAAWITEELLALDRRQSLEGTGSLEVTVAVPRKFQPPAPLLALGLTPEEVHDLFQMLFETVRSGAAITLPEDVNIDIRHERFAPRNREIGMREVGAETGALAWTPSSATQGNRRLEILMKVFERKGITADPLLVLHDMWRHLVDANGPWADTLVKQNAGKLGAINRLKWERFEFRLASPDHLPLLCDRCGRIWWRTVADVCPGWRCKGSVGPTAVASSHYARLYRDLTPTAMSVQEHTAQWASATASGIQDEFVKGRLNVLSCSTTFELGVDVGEIQAVLLRNVPPSPANYVQRAGRAGRRTDSAALVVTYAQRRSHDRSYFDRPVDMVAGTIAPPAILLDNASIVRRHMHSVAFAAFERRCVDAGELPHRTVEDYFEPGDDRPPTDERFIAWLNSKPTALAQALERIVPTATKPSVGLDSWAWVSALWDENPDEPTHGWLGRAGAEARDDVAALDALQQEAAQEQPPNYNRAHYLQNLARTLRRRDLLGYLATRNVLPKYGFPTDVVSLNVAGSGDRDAANLDLSRDLRMAISDYAPGSLTVAGKHLWESIGLVRRGDREWPTYRWAVCKTCGAFRRSLGENVGDCTTCGSNEIEPGMVGQYLLPMFGFVGKKSSSSVGDSRPPRLSTRDAFFGSYRGGEPPLSTIEGLAGSGPWQYRTSRQGRITVINRGPAARGFRVCSWCGWASQAPEQRSKPTSKKKHPDPRRPGKECEGSLMFRHLGHEFLTDVMELRPAHQLSYDQYWSLLYALLEAAPAIGISRDDVDGTLHVHSSDGSRALILYDTVPGGAGYARRLADHLPDLFKEALRRVSTCECGIDTSCYGCLRSYGNQALHDRLQRGLALEILAEAVGAAP